jgi:hypothetical protein
MLTEVNEFDDQENKRHYCELKNHTNMNVISLTYNFYKKVLDILCYPMQIFYKKSIVGYYLKGNTWRSCYVKPSTYKLDNFKSDIEYLQKYYNDDYLLCISYNEGDTQIGITGSVKINENPIDTSIREIHEETTNLLSLDKKMIMDYGIVDVTLEFNQLDSIIDSNNISIYRFTFNVEEDTCIRCCDIPCSSTEMDDETQKICVYIHGTKEILQSKFNHFNSEDSHREVGVDSICIIPIKDLEYML